MVDAVGNSVTKGDNQDIPQCGFGGTRRINQELTLLICIAHGHGGSRVVRPGVGVGRD